MGYLGAVFCLLLAWMALDYGSPAGLIFSLISGALVFPPIWKWLSSIGKSMRWQVRWFLAVVISFAAIGFNSSTPKAEAVAAERVAKQAAKEKVEQEIASIEREKNAAKDVEQKQSGEHCLSGWDGSFPDLKDSVKRAQRNPRSFEHVETVRTQVDETGTFGLVMSYRAENGFGGINLEAIGVEVTAQTCDFKLASEQSLAARLRTHQITTK